MEYINYPLLCHWGGEFVEGSGDVNYRGGDLCVVLADSKMSFDELLAQIYKHTELDQRTVQLKMKMRYPTLGSFKAVPISNDYSLGAMWACVKHSSAPSMELYIEVIEVESLPQVDLPLSPLPSTIESMNVQAIDSTCQSQSDPMELRIDPGPMDPTVLILQEEHRSMAVWNGEVDGPLSCRHHIRSLTHGWVVDERILHYVKLAGFYGIHRLGSLILDRALITALVERWRQETHSFHLAVGEATVTLQDVAVLMGLRVHGPPVIGTSNHVWPDLAEQLLGVRPPPEALSGSSLKHTWLRENFSSLPPEADDLTIQCYARAYILILMGGALFADKSGNDIQLIYLQLLGDWDRVAQYSWGSATLAFLYRQLCRASRRSAHEISGPLILLQLWSWEHIHIGRPTIVQSRQPHPLKDPQSLPLPERVHREGDPLGCRWLRMKLARTDGISGLTYYRDALDHQRDDQMTWQPYTQEILQALPEVCRSDQPIWCSVAPLICFDIVEWHFPDRVMRQFGFHQTIPLPCDTVVALHAIDRRGKHQIDWSEKHIKYVDLWARREDTIVEGDDTRGPMSYHDPYMIWYRQITRLFITPSTRPPSTHYQPTSLDFHLLTQSLASIHRRCRENLDQLNANCPPDPRSFIGDIVRFCDDSLDKVGYRHLIQAPEVSSSSSITPVATLASLSPPQTRQDVGATSSLTADGNSRGSGKGKSQDIEPSKAKKKRRI